MMVTKPNDVPTGYVLCQIDNRDAWVSPELAAKLSARPELTLRRLRPKKGIYGKIYWLDGKVEIHEEDVPLLETNEDAKVREAMDESNEVEGEEGENEEAEEDGDGDANSA